MSTALARFLQRQLDARGMTADQLAKKHGLNSSGLYQILRGERTYVQDRTLERIAAALGMTLAAMIAAMTHSGAEADPDEAEWVALIRQVPVENRSAARAMLLGLAIQPSQPRRPSTRHRDGAPIPRSGGRRHLDAHTRPGDDPGNQGSLPTVSTHFRATLAAISRENVLSNLKVWLGGATAFSAAQSGVVG